MTKSRRWRWARWFVVAPIAAVLLVTVGTWVYIHFIRDDAPDRLALSTATTTAAGTATASDDATSFEGTWQATTGSQAGYRVKEILFGQRADAVGRTNDVTGGIDIAGRTVKAASFTVDLATVTSDENRRDNQFRGRIMNVATYPTATFVLADPIEIAAVPAQGQQVTIPATGDLTLRGTKKRVTIDLSARWNGSTIEIVGSVPVVFAEWGIPNPSFGPAETEDHGEFEFLVVLARR
jgi:polyisoprenoid-binding protein YceI